MEWGNEYLRDVWRTATGSHASKRGTARGIWHTAVRPAFGHGVHERLVELMKVPHVPAQREHHGEGLLTHGTRGPARVHLHVLAQTRLTSVPRPAHVTGVWLKQQAWKTGHRVLNEKHFTDDDNWCF